MIFKSSRINKTLKWLFVSFTLMFSSFWGLLEFPSLLFPYQHINKNLHIYSDKVLPDNIKNIAEQALLRLTKSDLYKADKTYRVHITTDHWRWRLLTQPINYTNIGGFCHGFRRNVFIRPSDIANNRIIPPGKTFADANQRDLIYYIVHEVGHALLFDEVGYIANFSKLPVWLQEGYPDYIAKRSFDFDKNLTQFNYNEWRLTTRSGLYVRYHLYMSYLIDKKGFAIGDIFKQIPNESQIIEGLKAL